MLFFSQYLGDQYLVAGNYFACNRSTYQTCHAQRPSRITLWQFNLPWLWKITTKKLVNHRTGLNSSAKLRSETEVPSQINYDMDHCTILNPQVGKRYWYHWHNQMVHGFPSKLLNCRRVQGRAKFERVWKYLRNLSHKIPFNHQNMDSNISV